MGTERACMLSAHVQVRLCLRGLHAYTCSQGKTNGMRNARKYGCGPVANISRKDSFWAYNRELNAAARSSGVALARVWHSLIDEWRSHPPQAPGETADCTHFCSDDTVWMRYHAAVRDALVRVETPGDSGDGAGGETTRGGVAAGLIRGPLTYVR